MLIKSQSSTQISNLGSDLTFCNLSVSPLHREERQKLNMMQKTGLDTLIRSGEKKNNRRCL